MGDNHMHTVVIMECLYENKMTVTNGEMMQESAMDTVLETVHTIQKAPASSSLHLAYVLYGPEGKHIFMFIKNNLIRYSIFVSLIRY